MCIVFDYPRTLAQRSLPVGLRSLLIREYGDNTAPWIIRSLNTLAVMQPIPCGI
ncbi:hypothetical protein GZD98_005021 [Escherichia coli]|nr:hypothetical protein [Escherichia coli]EFI9452914.1 hypothetical protein [Escherichia coli]EFI9789477.1 hypothetical protein [Escherichia coli]